MSELDTKKFAIQIVVAVTLTILIQFFVYPLIIETVLSMPGTQTAQNQLYMTSISAWFLAFSLTFVIYPDNEIINSYLFCSLVPLSIIVFREFLELFFYDILHILPIIVVVYTMLKKRETINWKYVAIASPIITAWYATVRILGLNYPYYELYTLLGVVYLIIWPVLNVLIAYGLSYFTEK